jgi:hypothetical protein
MVIDAHAQIVSHPLPHTFRVIVVDVAGHSSECSNDYRCDSRQDGKFHFVSAQQRTTKRDEPLRRLVRPDDVVEDHFQRPGRGKGHSRLNHHRQEDDDDPTAVRTEKLADQPHLAGGRNVHRCGRRRGHGY